MANPGALLLTAPAMVLLVTWCLELLSLAWPAVKPDWVGAAMMTLFLIVATPRLRRSILILSCGLTIAALALAAAFGSWDLILSTLNRATIFAAFFGTVILLRATADVRPETGRTRALFRRLSKGEQASAFLVGSHVIGSVLVVGVMAILAPVQPRDASEEERRSAALAAQRGMCLAAMWSPFWIAMAVAYQHLPDVPLWQIIALGLPLAGLHLGLAHWLFERDIGWRAMARAVLDLRPIFIPVALCAAVITLVNSVTALTTIQTVVVCMPVLCILSIAALGPRVALAQLGTVGTGVGRVIDEVALVTAAVVLGSVLQHAMAASGIIDWISALSLASGLWIVLMILVVGVTAVLGIHQLVTVTVMFALIIPLPDRPGDLVLMEAALVGWAIASMIGFTAVSVAVAGSMFRVPPEKLVFGPNLAFAAMVAVVGAVVLVAVDAL